MTIKAIKLVESRYDDTFYRINYVAGICGAEDHDTKRPTFEIRELRNNRNQLTEIESIDMSCLSITLELLKSIEEFPKLFCLFIEETEFVGEETWNYFCKLTKNLLHLGVNNTMKMRHKNGNITNLSDIKPLIDTCTKLKEIDIVFREMPEITEIDYNLFVKSFENISNGVNFISLKHSDELGCSSLCYCRNENKKIVLQDSNVDKIVNNLINNSPDIKYFRFESNGCPFKISSSVNNISEFKAVVALNLKLDNEKFDEIEAFQDLYENFFKGLCRWKLESFTGQFGDCSIDDLLLNVTGPLPNLKYAKLFGGVLQTLQTENNEFSNKLKCVDKIHLINYLISEPKDIIDFIQSMNLKKLYIKSNELNFNDFEEYLTQGNDIKFNMIGGRTRSQWKSRMSHCYDITLKRKEKRKKMVREVRVKISPILRP